METDGELDEKFEILDRVTSTLADSFVRLMMTLDPAVDEPELLNKTDSVAEDDFVHSLGWFLI